jgi:hypothetical protein
MGLLSGFLFQIIGYCYMETLTNFCMLILYTATCWTCLLVLLIFGGIFQIFLYIRLWVFANGGSFTSFPIWIPFLCLAWLLWLGILVLCWIKMVEVGILFFLQISERELLVFPHSIWWYYMYPLLWWVTILSLICPTLSS